MICGFEGRETGVRAAAGAGGGTGTCGGRSGQRQGARGDGCPARRPSGSAAAAPLGLTAGPEPQRSGGGDGGGSLTILPRGPVPSNRHRPRCGSTGSAAAAGEGRRRRRSRRSWSRRCQSRPLVPAVGPRQCPFLSPIVNITGRLSPWHTRNRTFWPAAPASGAHSLEASSGKRDLIGLRPPSLPCQQVRLRADQGLAAGGRRNRRVGRDKAEDWAEARRTRMQPRSPAALLQLPPGGSLKLLQALIEARPV
uniref:uncharacterized protein LOC118520027 n=1 Tax=Halichoerus grypus TaxID=9711 RepID=UPI0016597883|nr:uncharacterized protein LOC118520027 [Halichoerus grypus]